MSVWTAARPIARFNSRLKAVRSGKGLGDSLYLQSVVRHLVEGGAGNLEVCTSWPDVFRPLQGRIRLSPFRRERIDVSYHYISRKRIQGTDQFIDCCLSAGLSEPVDLRLDWVPQNKRLVDNLRSSGKPIVIVQLPRVPMGRADGYGDDLLPDCRAIQKVIDRLDKRALTVQIGAGKPLHRFRGIDLDLANKTSVRDLLDVASVAAGAVGYCSFIAPLAESLRKPMLLVWSRRGLNSRNDFVRAITPDKIIHRPQTSRAIMDDCTLPELEEAVNAFYQSLGSEARL